MSRGVVLSLIAVYGLAVAVAITAVGWVHHKPYPCRTTFERVREGMTRAEVYSTVGGPPGNYISPGTLPPMYRGAFRVAVERWSSDDGHLQVIFSDDGIAESVYAAGYANFPRPNRPERLLAWLITGRDHWRVTLQLSITPDAYSLDTLGQILGFGY